MTSLCAECGSPILHRPGKVRRTYCGAACRKRASRRMSQVGGEHPERQPVTEAPGPGRAAPEGLPRYDASAIRILGDDEILERFLFARVAELGRKYPHVAPDFIRRLIESVAQSGCPLELAVARYLDRDKTVEVPDEFIACHLEAVRALRWA